MSPHTPGDWFWVENEHGMQEIRSLDCGEELPVLVEDSTFDLEFVNAFDKNLVVASPDLLAACKSWLNEFDRQQEQRRLVGDMGLADATANYHAQRIAATRAAVAKAEALLP